MYARASMYARARARARASARHNVRAPPSPSAAKVHEKAIELHAIASLKVALQSDNHNNTAVDDQNGAVVVPAVTVSRAASTPRSSPADTPSGAPPNGCVNTVSNGDLAGAAAAAGAQSPSNGGVTPAPPGGQQADTLAPARCRRGGSIAEMRVSRCALRAGHTNNTIYS